MGPSDSWASRSARGSTAQVSRVAHSSLCACRAHYPGGPTAGPGRFSRPPSRRPSPYYRRVGVHGTSIGAFSGFTRVAACALAQPPFGGLCHGASRWRSPAFPRRAFPRPSATEAYRPNSSGGTSTRWMSAPSRRTVKTGTPLLTPRESAPPASRWSARAGRGREPGLPVPGSTSTSPRPSEERKGTDRHPPPRELAPASPGGGRRLPAIRSAPARCSTCSQPVGRGHRRFRPTRTSCCSSGASPATTSRPSRWPR
jgi:hypothetical protein